MKMFYEGKAKKLFADEKNPNSIVVYYKDDLTAFNALKKGNFEDKGKINCDFTVKFFNYLETKGINTHLMERISDRELRVLKLTIVPLEVVVRNRVAGSLAKKFNLEEGKVLPQPLVEFYYKDDALGDPLVTEDQVVALNLTSYRDFAKLKEMSLKINSALQELFQKCSLDLVDFKLEFGLNPKGELILGDEITPDSCRLWDVKTNEKMDKDRFRRDLGGIKEAYEEVLKRVASVLG